MNTSQLTITQLASTINAHTGKADQYADKAEQHYKAAGIHLIEAKQRIANGEYEGGFVAFLKNECKGLSSSRAYELIAIGNGSTTLAAQREAKAASMKKSREAVRHVVDSKAPEADTEMSEGDRLVAKGQAAWRRIPAGEASIRENVKFLGVDLLDAYKADPKEFDNWKALNGMQGITPDMTRDLIFYGRHADTLEQLRVQLADPFEARKAYNAACMEVDIELDPMFMADIDAEIEADKKRQVSPEQKVFVEIIEVCQGKTLAQLQKMLKAVNKVL